MAIKKIIRLHEYRIFRDFTWPTDLHGFKEFNLIYGWNGSGKSTLSTLFRLLESRTTCTEGRVTVCIDDVDVKGDAFESVTECVRVFNDDFVSESVFTAKETVAPIYVIGKENVDKQKQVEKFKADLKTEQGKVIAARAAHGSATSSEDTFCVDKGKMVKDTIGGGGNKYSNYNKASFRRRIEGFKDAASVVAAKMTDDQRSVAVAQAKSAAKPSIPELTYGFPDLTALANTVTSLLARTVVSETINVLCEQPSVATWVREGMILHKDQQADSCLYCTRPLVPERIQALEKHFSNAFEQLQTDLDGSIDDLQTALDSAKSITFPSKAEFYDDVADGYATEKTGVDKQLRIVETALGALIGALQKKKESPFAKVTHALSTPAIDATPLAKTKEAIKKHNQETETFVSRVDTALSRLESAYVADAYDEHKKRVDAVTSAKEVLDGATAKESALAQQIKDIEAEIISFREPADELNKDLKAYLGHSEICLVIKGTGYQIMRGASQATALSEGEKTAIALLYFLRSLTDRTFIRAHGVVVLDDPVSSLDANALYNAFAFIKSRTEGIGQLFILTHSFGFFRQVKNWFHHLPGQRSKDETRHPARFYMVKSMLKSGQRAAVICAIDPLLVNYESEYHYLFKRVYEEANATDAAHALEHYYGIPNVARRLMESFLAFRLPDETGDVLKRLDKVDCDPTKKARIHRFLNTYSHRDGVIDPGHDPSVLSETPAILRDLLELIEAVDREHYAGMKRLAEPRVDESELTPVATT